MIWVIPDIKELKIFSDNGESVCRLAKWMEFFHALAFGRLFVWEGNGANVRPVHFCDFYRYIEETSHYSSDGSENTHGGYHKKLKRQKSIWYSPKKTANLVTDFSPSKRSAFPTKNYSLPECLIWKHNQKAWW